MTVTTIKFPLRRADRSRRSPRVPDKTGLHGAAACAAGMITCAVVKREAAGRERSPLLRRLDRAGMRHAALMARLFAGQIADADPRLDAAEAERRSLLANLLAA